MQTIADGRIEVSGRWLGVRGRRFVRPTLTVTFGEDGAEQRWLAELEHKPWAAEDGELWTATFPVDVDLGSASSIELAVAPDIEIALGAGAVQATRARTPRAKAAPSSRRPSARAQDLERLTTRLAAADAALERERERRAQVEEALERHRTDGRTAAAELGRVKAELELARTVQRESEAMAAELDATRRELRAVHARYEQLAGEHDRSLDVHSQLETELRERSGALESARDALDQERSRTAEALERERARRTEALEQERARGNEAISAERARGADAVSQERARSAQRLQHARAQATAPPTESYTAPGMEDEPAPPLQELEAVWPAPAEHHAAEHHADARHRPAPVAHRSERPVNPALRSRPNWAWRIVALLVIVAVLIALYVVLHSTILH